MKNPSDKNDEYFVEGDENFDREKLNNIIIYNNDE